MKDNIGDIIVELYENVQDGEYWDKTVDELTALMCYREIRAFLIGMGRIYDMPPNTAALMMKHITKEYPIELLIESIEKVKSEHEPTK